MSERRKGMTIRDLSSFTSEDGIATSVWKYEEADTFVIQHDFVHLSFFEQEFREFVETLITALKEIERDGDGVIMQLHKEAFRKTVFDETIVTTSEN